jgi:hypothetical protein
MPWTRTEPPTVNRHTLRAKKLDAKAAKAERKGNWLGFARLDAKADRAAKKGGWF